jgi:hypothetical protein
MGEEKVKKQKTRLILVGRKMNRLVRSLHSFLNARNIECLSCRDIFNTIVTITKTEADSEKIICIDSKEPGKFIKSFFRKIAEQNITCCCLDEDSLTEKLSLPKNIVTAKNKNQFVTILKNVLPASINFSTNESKYKQQDSAKSDVNLSQSEIKALFQDSDS